MGVHWTGLVFGRIFGEEDLSTWERLWEWGVEGEAEDGLLARSSEPRGLLKQYEGETKWMGFAVAITDAATDDATAVDYDVCSVAKLGEMYEGRIAVAREQWARLKDMVWTEWGINIGEGELIFASDYR